MRKFIVTLEVKDKCAKGGWHLRHFPVDAAGAGAAKAGALTKAETFSLDVRGITGIKEDTTVTHTLEHALRPALCKCGAQDIIACVVCGKKLESGRKHVDTCNEHCYQKLFAAQRAQATP